MQLYIQTQCISNTQDAYSGCLTHTDTHCRRSDPIHYNIKYHRQSSDIVIHLADTAQSTQEVTIPYLCTDLEVQIVPEENP